MSIGNNTTGLQRILQAVNSLPEADSGGSGNTGVTVQRHTGSFTTDTSGNATASCGFQPDIVVIPGLVYTGDGNNEFHAAVVFTETTKSNYNQFATGYSDTYPFGISILTQRTSSGFSVNVQKFNSNWSKSVVSSATFNYVALKYTE